MKQGDGQLTNDEVFQRLQNVFDPEIPGLSIVDLGMVLSVAVSPEIRVILRPTFIGCPAVSWIRTQVQQALQPHSAHVEFDMSAFWSTVHISPAGRMRLHEFGIAPPTSDPGPVPCPLCGARNTRQSSRFGSTLCRASYYCEACHQPFEAWKSL